MSSDSVVFTVTRHPPTKLHYKILHWAVNQAAAHPLDFWPHPDDPNALIKKTKIIECITSSLSSLGIIQGLLASVSASLLSFGCFFDSRLSAGAQDANTLKINHHNLFISQVCLTFAVGIQVLTAGYSMFVLTALIPASRGLFSPYNYYSDHPMRLRIYLSVSAFGVQAGCFLFSIGSFFLVLEFVIPGHSGLVPAWTMVALTLTLMFMPDWLVFVERAYARSHPEVGKYDSAFSVSEIVAVPCSP